MLGRARQMLRCRADSSRWIAGSAAAVLTTSRWVLPKKLERELPTIRTLTERDGYYVSATLISARCFTTLRTIAMTPFHLYLYGPMRGPIQTSFEEAEARLSQLPLLHFEPDGSFVWTRDSGRQLVDGMIYDAAGRIQYCELRGQCAYLTWRVLQEAIAGVAAMDDLEIMTLPEQRLQDLQTFEAMLWPNDRSSSC